MIDPTATIYTSRCFSNFVNSGHEKHCWHRYLVKAKERSHTFTDWCCNCELSITIHLVGDKPPVSIHSHLVTGQLK